MVSTDVKPKNRELHRYDVINS